MRIEEISKLVQVLSVVVGVVISILSFNRTRDNEAKARTLEAQKPFLELRQRLYVEAVKAAGVLSTPESHTMDELDAAKRRFRELYVAELSMVEVPEVEGKMVELASRVDPGLIPLNPAQQAAYDLSHALRDSFMASWSVGQK
jgi:hypothetical protein